MLNIRKRKCQICVYNFHIRVGVDPTTGIIDLGNPFSEILVSHLELCPKTVSNNHSIKINEYLTPQISAQFKSGN